MRELRISEVRLISGGSEYSCNKDDPPPYEEKSTTAADLVEYMKLWFLLN